MSGLATMEIVIDAIDVHALRPDDLPALPSRLLCGRCGLPQGEHGSSVTCPSFQRPVLPAGYAFIDELAEGDQFSFLSRRAEDCGRTLLHRECCVAGQLIRVDSAAERCAPATHWLQESTIVQRLSRAR